MVVPGCAAAGTRTIIEPHPASFLDRTPGLEDEMLILMVEVQIKPDKRDEFLASITENARACERDEAGCLRFDILQDSEDPNKYFYYEVYRNDDDVKAHFESPHFHKYRAQATEFVEKQTPHRLNSIYPADASWAEPRGSVTA